MAVTLTDFDLQQPQGELSNNYFPQGDMCDQLDGWLAAAVAKVEADTSIATADHDDAAAAWVYHRAYTYIANQLAALPSSVSAGTGQASVSYSVNQVTHYRDLAASKLAEFGATRSVNSTFGTHFTLASGRRGL